MFDIVILAGGRASRMGGEDKGLLLFQDKPLIEHGINILPKQHIIISANRNQEIYAQYGTVVNDATNDFQGPLAGISAALHYLQQHSAHQYVLVLPVDTPFLNRKHIDALTQEYHADINVAFDGEKLHPTLLYCKQELLPSIDEFLQQGERKLGKWLMQHHYHQVLIDASALININTPEQLL